MGEAPDVALDTTTAENELLRDSETKGFGDVGGDIENLKPKSRCCERATDQWRLIPKG